MKQVIVGILILMAVSLTHASDLSQTYGEKLKALEPAENTSVRSDYLFEQIALGSEYTIKLLDQLSDQNVDLNDRLDTVILKFDVLIQQNQKIIQLLEKEMNHQPSE